jgi:hypothetical protein
MTAIERANAGAISSAAGKLRGPPNRQITQPGRRRRAVAQNEIQAMVTSYGA